jgi:cytochrome c peroxidase
MLAEDGVVLALHVEDSPGVCNVSAGEALLDAI